jgi:hypothetical protein
VAFCSFSVAKDLLSPLTQSELTRTQEIASTFFTLALQQTVKNSGNLLRKNELLFTETDIP